MSYTTQQSDSFNRTDQALLANTPDNANGGSDSSGWADIYGSGWTVASNRAVNPGSPGLYIEVTNVTASTDCRVSGIVYGSAIAPVGPVARYSFGQFYMFDPTGTDARLYYFDSAAFNLIQTTTFAGFADGDELAIVCNGGTITGEVNGVTVVTKTDTNIASGKPGMYSPGSSTGFDSWKYQTGTAPAVTATHLAVGTAPVGNQSGVAYTTEPIVNVLDGSNAVVTGDTSTVTASITVLTGSVALSGTTTKAAVAGVANFAGTGLKVTGTGSYTMTFSDGALTVATTGTLYVGAADVHITSQATTAYSERAHGNIVVAVRDGGGTTVGNATNSILLALTVITGSATIKSGTTTRSASSGIATFNDIIVEFTDGSTWTYAVSSSGLTGDTSSPLTGTVRSLDVTDVNT